MKKTWQSPAPCGLMRHDFAKERQTNMRKMKRIVTIQDISCFGKCSLTVALPVISAMGIECSIIPTAVLSTHTGGFSGFTFADLTCEIPKISAHWQKEGLDFDGIYTGYLGSKEQLSMVSDFIDAFRSESGPVFIDPVMADNGKLYTGFTHEFAMEMAKLCGKADIIVPNLTEAAIMLGEEYVADGHTEEYIHGLLKRLCALGAKCAIVTGVRYGKDSQGAVAYDSTTGKFYEYHRENIPVSYHGTGDVFSSSLMGAVTNGLTLDKALQVAVDFTVESIKKTVGDDHHKYGVKFEECLNMLV